MNSHIIATLLALSIALAGSAVANAPSSDVACAAGGADAPLPVKLVMRVGSAVLCGEAANVEAALENPVLTLCHVDACGPVMGAERFAAHAIALIP